VTQAAGWTAEKSGLDSRQEKEISPSSLLPPRYEIREKATERNKKEVNKN
jgi:hypothetical protein